MKVKSKTASIEAIKARIAARKAARLARTKTAPTPQARPAAGSIPGISRLNRTLSRVAENTSGFDKRLAALEGRTRFIERSVKNRTVSLPGSEDGTTVKGKKVHFMFTKAIKYLVTGKEDGCEFEAEVMRETEKRAAKGLIGKTALEAGTDSIGGFLVPTQVIQDLIDLIRANQVMTAAGITQMPGLTGSPVQIPKQTGGSTGYWVDENVAPTESNQTFGQISMTPHTAAALVKISKRLIMMASPAAEALVRKDLSEQLALLVDLAILRGTGANGQPIGIMNWPGVNPYAIGTNGGDLTYEHLVGIIQTVRDANGLRDARNVGWVLSTGLIGVVMKMVDGNNRPIFLPWSEGVTNWETGTPGAGGPVGRLFGYPVYDTTQIPTNLTKGTGTGLTEIYFGDMSTVIQGGWGGIEIAASDQTSDAFAKRQVWVQIAQDLDIALRQETRLTYCGDVKAT